MVLQLSVCNFGGAVRAANSIQVLALLFEVMFHLLSCQLCFAVIVTTDKLNPRAFPLEMTNQGLILHMLGVVGAPIDWAANYYRLIVELHFLSRQVYPFFHIVLAIRTQTILFEVICEALRAEVCFAFTTFRWSTKKAEAN